LQLSFGFDKMVEALSGRQEIEFGCRWQATHLSPLLPPIFHPALQDVWQAFELSFCGTLTAAGFSGPQSEL